MAGFYKLSVHILIFVVGIIGWLGQVADTAADEPVEVKVLLKDYAGVSPDVLEKAKEITTRIYRRIGVDVTWFGTGADRQAVPRDPAELQAFCSSVLVVNLHEEVPPEDEGRVGMMGMAPEGSRVARVFMEPIAQAASRAYLDPSTVLGYVIAHELGHLLLPPNSHSAKGLMRASLDDMGARLGRLWFDETQAAQIRVGLSGSGSGSSSESASNAPALIARAVAPARP